MTPTCLQEGRSTLHRGFHSLLLPARHLLSFGSQKTSNRPARDELGLGPVSPAVPSGQIPQAAGQLKDLSSFLVWLDGVPVDPSLIEYVGVAPGWAGLYVI